MADRRCEACGRKMDGPGDIRVPRDGMMVCTGCNRKEFLVVPGVERVSLSKAASSRLVLGHGGGDGKELRHCPLCGSGGIVGRSDGTTECTLCNSVFSVQMQPQQPFAPQTVNGQPVAIPGMPNSPSDDVAPSDPNPMVDSTAPQEQDSPDATVGLPGFGDDEIEAPVQGFNTTEGGKADRDGMVQHLALRLATGSQRPTVMARIRQANLARWE